MSRCSVRTENISVILFLIYIQIVMRFLKPSTLSLTSRMVLYLPRDTRLRLLICSKISTMYVRYANQCSSIRKVAEASGYLFHQLEDAVEYLSTRQPTHVGMVQQVAMWSFRWYRYQCSLPDIFPRTICTFLSLNIPLKSYCG